LIVTNLMQIQSSIYVILPYNITDAGGISRQQGLATLLFWLCLNKYMLWFKDLAVFPNTLIRSTRMVLNGIVGVLPVMIGIAFLSGVMLNNIFRFNSVYESMFTMYYVMNGDTMFDTLFGAHQVSPLFTIFFVCIWCNFSIQVISQIALA